MTVFIHTVSRTTQKTVRKAETAAFALLLAGCGWLVCCVWAPNQFIAENTNNSFLFFSLPFSLVFEWLFTCPLRCWCVSHFAFFITIISDVCECFILIQFFLLSYFFTVCQVDVYMSAKCLALSRFLALLPTERVATATAAVAVAVVAVDVVATAVLWNCI